MTYFQDPSTNRKSSRGMRLGSDGELYRKAPLILTAATAAVIGTTPGFVRQIGTINSMPDSDIRDDAWQAYKVFYLGPEWSQYTEVSITAHMFLVSSGASTATLGCMAFFATTDPGSVALTKTQLATMQAFSVGANRGKLTMTGLQSECMVGRVAGPWLIVALRNESSGGAQGVALPDNIHINVAMLP